MNAGHKLCTPPSVAPLARAPWAPNLLTVYVGPDAVDRLTRERDRQRRFAKPYGVGQPVLALPKASDPASFRWPVRNHRVAINGVAPRRLVLRLMQALMRDGAEVVAGVDDRYELHTASDRQGNAHGRVH